MTFACWIHGNTDITQDYSIMTSTDVENGERKFTFDVYRNGSRKARRNHESLEEIEERYSTKFDMEPFRQWLLAHP